MIKQLMLAIFLVTCLSSCLYRMPEDEDCLTSVPIFNNPNILEKPAPALIPGAQM